MSDDITIGFGLDARGFIAGIRSTEEQAKKSTQALMRAYQSSASSANGLSDAVINTRAQTLLNLGVTMKQVEAFKETAVSVRKYKEELKRVGEEYQNDSARLNAHLLAYGKQNDLLSLATINTRELAAEEAALNAARKARPQAIEPSPAKVAKVESTAPAVIKAGVIDSSGLNDFNSKVDAATAKVKSLAIAMLGIGSARQLSAMADEWTTVNNRLKLVISSSYELKQVRGQLMASANNTGQSLGTVAELYNKLAMSQAQTGISGRKLLQLTDTINKAMVIGGGSAESQAAALVQLSQAFASGTLRGEELNSVLEQAPGLAQTLAKGLGVTVGQLRALAANGKLTSEAVANAILKQSADVNAQFGKMDKTIGQSATSLKNKVMSYVGALNESSGATRKAGAVMEWMGNHLGTVSTVLSTVSAIYTGKYAASITMVIVRKYAEIAASKQSAAAMLKEAAAAKLLAAAKTGGAGNAAKGGAGAASALEVAGGVASMAKGGWVGLAAGLATAAYAYYQIRQASKTVNDSLQTQIGSLDELIAKYKQASDTGKQALRKQAEDAYEQSAHEFRSGLDDLQKRYNGLIGMGQTRNMPLGVVDKQIKSIFAEIKAGRSTVAEGAQQLNKLFGIRHDSKLAGELAVQAMALEDVAKKANQAADSVNAMGGVAPKFKASSEQIAAAAQQTSAAIQKLIDAQKKNIDLLQKQKQLMAGGLSSGVAEVVAKANAEGMTGQKLKEYTQQQKQQEKLQQQIDDIKSVADTLQSLGKSAEEAKAELIAGKDGLTLFQLSAKNATSAQIEQAKQLQAQSKAYKEQLQNQQTLKDMIQQAQEARAELFGGKNALIAFRMGLTHATNEQIRQAQAVNALTEQIQKQKSVLSTLEGLKEQVATLGMDSVQRQLYGLRKEGATPEQLRQAEAMLRQIKSFDDAQKDTKAAAKDLSDAAAELKDSSRSGDDTKQLSIFSKEYRDREEAYWTKKRQQERDGSGIGYLSGRASNPVMQNLNTSPLPTSFNPPSQINKDMNELLKASEVVQIVLSDGKKDVTFKGLFNTPDGAKQFKDILKTSLHSIANDMR